MEADILVDHVAVEVDMRVELSWQIADGPFATVLIRRELRWFDDDPTPDVIERIVCECDLEVALPAVFTAVDNWLFNGHKLRVLPHSWVPCDAGPDTGCVLLLEGRAIPVHPIRGPLGCWG